MAGREGPAGGVPRVVLQMQVTLDGYAGDEQGDVSWAFPQFDEEFTAWSVGSLRAAGVHVMGGVTGQGLAEYWPRPDIHERDRPFQAAINEMPKVVFSKTLDRLDWQNSRIERGDLAEGIERLKREFDGHILVHGGVRFAQSLTRLGLVDEYQLVVHPVVLGKGLNLFAGLDEPVRLEVIEARRLASGAVLHISRPRAEASRANPGGPEGGEG